ncbi:MAG: T9SS type A sorting domain-containing protein [Lewinellaceae bacterium]|nr:T9SS type A sorting domain-containing protein [Lewinellaceae bacterium]
MIFFLTLFSTVVQAQSGTAFRDFNGDGLKTGAEPGVQGIIVKLYGDAAFPAKDQLIGEAVTGANGTYNFAVSLVSGRAANPGEPLRIEFEIPTSFGCDLDHDVDFVGLGGETYGTSVQFIQGQQSNINFAINYPGQWVASNNPDVYVPLYTFGDPLLPGSAATEPGFVTFEFLESGVPQAFTGGGGTGSGDAGVPTPTVLATNAEVGSLYGVAFSRQAQKVFASAVIRRHCGFGPQGPGGIYLIDPYSPATDKTTDFLDLDAIGIYTYNNSGSYPANPMNNTSPVSDYIGTNAERGLPAGLNTPSTDVAAGDQVGKVSIGDIDISDDGRYLYILNLYDRKIYEIDLVDPINPEAPTMANKATRVRSWDVPDPGTNAQQGEHRPWGLKYYRGKLYVGVVLSGQDAAGNVVSPVSGSGYNTIGDELRGYVYDFDPFTQVFSLKLDFDFDYNRERPWIPWGYSPGHTSRYFSAADREYAEPIISDIEFDDQGNMLIGILDRKGHQYGINNNNYNGVIDHTEYATAGELLRANLDPNCDMFTIITNGNSADYYDDNFAHPESLQGPLAVLPGGGDALAVVLDPIYIRSGGVIRFNNTTGDPVAGSAYEIFDDRETLVGGDFEAVPSKANGLGDIELAGVAAPIEIGNLVWMDVDADGIQDGNEPGIEGVVIELLNANMDVIATTMTDNKGGYYFNHTNVMDPAGPATTSGPLPFTDYKVRISPTQFSGGIGSGPLNKMVLTSTDAVGTGLANRSDNDAGLVGGEALISLTTGAAGQNDHSYDFGMLVNDYGDLPDSYSTTDGAGGPRHQLDPTLYIGSCVDAEIVGQPDAMAGMMTGGDDNNTINASLPIGANCSDDEDGVSFATSLVPGQQACIEVSIVNTTGAMAKLQGWIDFDGNGMFNGNDELNTVDFAGGGAMIPDGGVTNVQYCFDVPAGATFSTGSTELYARFRLSPNGGLGFGGINANGSVPIGEVEDYKQPLAMLGDYVWIDKNYNGIQDNGETPVEGVTATLHDCSSGAPGNDLGTLQTDVNGFYKFIGLIDGEYCVCFALATANHPNAATMQFTAPGEGNETNDSDADQTSGCTPSVTLTAGDNYEDLDAGVYVPGKIGDIVFEDTNGNGVLDPGEPMINGATATISGTDGLGNPYTAPVQTTGPDGMYMFGDLPPGSYKITFTTPAGSNYVFTASDDPSNNGDDTNDSDANPAMGGMTPFYTIESGDVDLTVDAGMYLPGKLGDIVFEDTNGNGVFDQGEPTVNGATATISGTDGLGNPYTAPVQTTGPDGMYMFGDLPPGSYKITFTTPAGSNYVFTASDDPSGNGDDTNDSDANAGMGGMTPFYTIESGDVDLTVDAGMYLPGKLGDIVFEDTNGNGVFDQGEPTINGATATISGTDGLGNPYTAPVQTTGPDGMYMFGDLPPGSYKITFTTPAGSNYAFTAPDDPSGNGDDTNDSDANAAMGGMTPFYTIESGDVDLTVDAGMFLPGKIGDIVWEDTNGNGVLDPGEPTVNGATATISGTDGLGNPYTAPVQTTGPDGMYMFGNLTPGSYKITFTTPAGSDYVFIASDDPSNNGDDTNDSDANPAMGGMTPFYTIESGETDLTVDAGMYIPGKIGDIVWEDVNGNGVQDPGEPTVNGATATISGTDGLGNPYTAPVQTTGPDGMYMFGDLPPGSYKITFTTPAGSTYVFTASDDPSSNGDDTNDSDANAAMGGMTGMYPIMSGDTIPTVDAGMFVPGKLGDIVWEDWNHNGQQDAGEPPLMGATATISGTDGLGNPYTAPVQTTGPDGMYMFGDLWPGSYKITFGTPADFNPTKANEAGVADDKDSDADPAMGGMTEFYVIESQDTVLTVDAGYYAVDFGDLPDSYGTTEASDGPYHIIIPQLYLGSCIDAELDGQDEMMAGLMMDGDDNTGSSFGHPGGNGCDDEDGVTFTTPIVPGYQACIEISVVNTTGAPAVLQGWLDFDGNGSMAAEELTTGDFAGGGVSIPDGGVTGLEVCFDVPADAMYVMGDGFMRFRLSPDGGLESTGINADGSIPQGEVEDYKLPDAKVGNLIWEDRNYNGIQDPGLDVGLNGFEVELMWAGVDGIMGTLDDVTYTTVSSNMGGKDGLYMFSGLVPGDYKLTVNTDRFATLLGVGTDENVDSDDENGELFTIVDVTDQPLGENGINDMPGMTNPDNPGNSYPDNQDNLTFDFGYGGFDYGDLPNTFTTLEDTGMPGMEGPKHLFTPLWFMGACVDLELDGQPDYTAGYYSATDPQNPEPANEGDDNLAGLSSLPVGVACEDDENGVILKTEMIPGYQACFDVMTTGPADGVMQAWIDFDGSLDFGAGEAIEWNKVGGVTVTPTTQATMPAGANVITEICFTVPVTATFPNRETHMRFRFSDLGGLDFKNPYADGSYPFGEIEDFYQPLAALGDYVWHDVDGDGVQDANESGVPGATVELHDCTDPNNPVLLATTTTDGTGFYEFIGLIPMEKYCVHFNTSTATDGNANDYVFTFKDSPNADATDENDSDADVNGMTEPVMMMDRERNETIDAGVYVPVSIGNFVWLDLNENGAQDPGEPVVEGAKLFLSGTNNIGESIPGGMMVPDGQPIPATMLMTDANGEYLFTGLAPGTYKITFDISMITGPAELERFAQYLVFTFPDNTIDPEDSDVDPGNYDSPVGMSGFYTLLSGDQDLTVDGGIMVPCLPPTDIWVDMVMETTAIIHWTSNNEIFDVNTFAHCWNIAIGNNGFEPWNNEAVQLITVCSDDPNIVINGDQVSYMVEGLAPGTCYDVYVQEGCNGQIPPQATLGWVNAPGTPQIGDILGNPLLATDVNPDGLCTFDYPHIVTKSATAPDCPWGSQNYEANGTLTVTIEDSPSCGPSTFTITVTPVNNSTPGGTTPVAATDIYIDVPAGTYVYTDLDAGQYTVSVLETGPCRPKVNPVVMVQEVPNAIDNEGPDKFVTDILGNEVTQMGPYFLPEGACHYQQQLYVQAIDGCYGDITADGAVWAEVNMIPSTIDPGTQVIVTNDGFGVYLVDVNFSTGTTELTINVKDPDGNVTSMTYVVEVLDFNDPEVTIVGANNVTIPHCAESRDIIVTVYVSDLCDQTITAADVNFNANGTEVVNFEGDGYIEYLVTVSAGDDGSIWSASYTDDNGNTGFADVQISVEQAVADMPAVILAADENLTIPYCEEATEVCYSFQIYDDCQPVNPDLVHFLGGGSGLEITYVDMNSQTNVGFFEACGVVTAGTYVFQIEYDGQIVEPLMVINQQQNQAPMVILPGNLNFTVPVCEDKLTATFSIQISDDCDDLTLLESLDWEVGIQDYLGGPAPDLNLQWFYVEGYLEITAMFSAENDGNLLYATFTDSNGATTYVDAQINVTSQPDTWAPIIVHPSQDINVALDPCDDPLTEVCFYVSATDNCDDDVTTVVTVDGTPINGVDGEYCVEVGPGDHTIGIVSTDDSGNSSTEDFHIVVTQEEAPEDNLACKAFVNATLGTDCSVELLASTVLNGTWGCLTEEDFVITVIDDNTENGATIDGCGTFGYMISLADGVEANFTVCWGEVTAEDKTSPTIECPAPTDVSLTSGAEFICTDIESILISGTQYYTAYADGTTVAGSMSATLSWILSQTGIPQVGDNCGQVRVSVWDVLTESEDGCGYDVITRHFQVADRYNSDCTGAPMTASCTQEIRVRKPNIGDVAMPLAVVELECSDEVVLTTDGYPHPSVTGYPSVTTAYGTYDLDATYCNLGAAFVDSNPINVCENSYKVVREWTVVDWCNPVPVTNYTQIIKVGDTTPPVIGCNWPDTDWDGAGDMPVYSTGPFDCAATFPIAAPIVTDNCNTYSWTVDVVIHAQVNVYDQWGQVTGTQIVEQTIASYGPFGADQAGPYATGVPMSIYGNHYLHYTATDVCGNSSAYDCAFAVVDNIAPVAICDDNLHISIGSEGYARVYAEDVDEGSHDNCSEVTIKVRRAGGEWGPWVDFDCDDVHNFVTIELMVTDAAGNTNMCWLDVLIEDKITPFCHAPHSVSMHCDDDELLHIDWTDVAQLNEVFGEAWAEDNCNAIAEQTSVNNNLNDCGWGTVVRTFRATDDWGLTSTNACTQVITVYEVHNYEIKFPKDASAECGTPSPDTIAYNTIGCDLITVNVTDVPYTATSDECYKILRTYKVINWCEWDGESDPIVIGRDEDCDNNPGDENVWVIVRTTWNGNNPIFTSYLDRDNNETNTNPYVGKNRCQGGTPPQGHWANSTINHELQSVGHWQYTQVIKVYDFVAPTAVVSDYGAFCSESADCNGDVEITFIVEEDCDLSVVTVEGFIDAFADGILDGSASISGPVAIDATHQLYTISGNYPLGAHSFGVHIEDGCHNITWLEIPFEVVDCKAPTPVCINGLTVTLMPQANGCCAMAIWATDFIASPVSDCSEPIKYSIHRAEDVANGTDIPTPDQTGLVLDCNDDATTLIRIYSWDSAYNPYALQPDGTIGGPNYDYCETYVLVQAHESCAAPILSMIAGTIQTEESEGVEGAEVILSGNTSFSETTLSTGNYVFDVVENGYDYTVTPHLDINPLNGVTTFDLVLATKHILGVQLLDSPYKMIAADVNSSGSITTADMIQLRKLILGIYTDFPNNTSWRFVDADYVFPDPSNPWYEEFPESRNISDLSANMMAEDFIAAKIGDVNGTATPNLTSVEERNVNGLFTIQTQDIKVKSGRQYSVSFTAADLAKIQGYQFTLNFDPTALNYEGMTYGLAKEENFGLVYVGEGMITTSWNLPGGTSLSGDEVLFTVTFTAQTEADLSDLISIGSRITGAEAYNTGNELLDVTISFTNDATAAVFEVYQNTPNPFNGETKIGYNLPEDATVTITIQDVTGKTLKVMNQNGFKGYNNVMLDAKTLGASGVLYYTVATDKYTATKKMIVVK